MPVSVPSVPPASGFSGSGAVTPAVSGGTTGSEVTGGVVGLGSGTGVDWSGSVVVVTPPGGTSETPDGGGGTTASVGVTGGVVVSPVCAPAG